MDSAGNKQLLQHVFDELAQGNSKPFVASWAPDFCWTVTGTTKWSKTYHGKDVVMRELMQPLFSNFATQYKNTAQRFIAEDNYVVVECRGEVMTKSGKPYNNTYCYICRLEGGKLKELTEYLDTQLVVDTFGDVL